MKIPCKDWPKWAKVFEKEISLNAKQIDPNNEFDWWCITYGWAIAKGFDIDDAHKFATYIRYDTELA